jgi:hypothetical protein
MKTPLGLGAMVVTLSGCVGWGPLGDPGENPACVGVDEIVEIDDDLGGYTVADHASARSGTASARVGDAGPIEFEIETTAFGRVVASRGWDCSDRASYETDVEVVLRGHDFEIVLDGNLSFDLFSAPLLEVRDLSIARFADPFGLEAMVGATDTVVGVHFDLQGVDGLGSISLRLSDGRTIPAATLDLPWSVADRTFSEGW